MPNPQSKTQLSKGTKRMRTPCSHNKIKLKEYEMNKLILIRGISGSGKSTLAMKMQGFEHFEADMFFMKGGKYCYEPSRIKDAHAWCQISTLKALNSGADVVVSNTFTCIWEMKPYLEMGYPVQIIEAKGEWKSIHNIPEHAIKRMQQHWQELTPEMHQMYKTERSINLKGEAKCTV